MGTRNFEQAPEEGAEDFDGQAAFEVRWRVVGPGIRDASG
jgi:hypothetical protein